jgi:hypothetical protein
MRNAEFNLEDIVVTPTALFTMRYLISNHHDYAEVPQLVHDMTGVDR